MLAGLRGPVRAVEERIPGRLWRLEDDSGALWLKRLGVSRAFEAERFVLGLGLAGAPLLRAADASVGALLMEELSGDSVDFIGITEIHRAAGAWLARLHALPVEGEDPMPVEEALGARLRSLERRLGAEARGLPIAALRQAVEAVSLPEARRVWCHRDFQPRNWRWDGATLGVLDFEHARPDLWVADLAKLEGEAWVGRPALRQAFFEGYGRRPSDAEEGALRALVGLHGLFALGWGRRHGEAAFVALGEGILGRWRA